MSAVMSLCKGLRLTAKNRSQMSEQFKVNDGVHQVSVLPPLLVTTIPTNESKLSSYN